VIDTSVDISFLHPFGIILNLTLILHTVYPHQVGDMAINGMEYKIVYVLTATCLASSVQYGIVEILVLCKDASQESDSQ